MLYTVNRAPAMRLHGAGRRSWALQPSTCSPAAGDELPRCAFDAGQAILGRHDASNDVAGGVLSATHMAAAASTRNTADNTALHQTHLSS